MVEYCYLTTGDEMMAGRFLKGLPDWYKNTPNYYYLPAKKEEEVGLKHLGFMAAAILIGGTLLTFVLRLFERLF